ncbi:MAG: bifunctional riboflavin kinase/FAD synthetase [Clostridia bacterium]|nr:bifunctional riboflavin kinase/FAD synthetase [Clostridia bacterium]
MQNAVILGSFDGVHLGHKAVIEAAKGYNCIAVIFSLPPKIVSGDAVGLLMSLEEKMQHLKNCGVNEIYVLEFKDIKDMSPQDFLSFLKVSFCPKRMVCGFNYRFGKGALGDINLIREFSKENDIEFLVVDCVEREGIPVSSSVIRSLIKQGDISLANRLLDHDFGFEAKVISGDKRGRTIGFPTINQRFPKELVKPRFGVYISEVFIDGKKYKAITNLGIRPTYKTDGIFCETHIPQFSAEIYGKQVRINLKRFLRDERKFDSLDRLKDAIYEDVLKL